MMKLGKFHKRAFIGKDLISTYKVTIVGIEHIYGRSYRLFVTDVPNEKDDSFYILNLDINEVEPIKPDEFPLPKKGDLYEVEIGVQFKPASESSDFNNIAIFNVLSLSKIDEV